MEISFSKEAIAFDKELNDLDRFTLDFISILQRLNLKYVLISGYVAILFGRSRSSEDIDMFLQQLNKEQFSDLWNELVEHGFECINSMQVEQAYDDYLAAGYALRFCRVSEFLPNMEIKFPKGADEHWVITHRKKVVVNGHELFISPLEVQIAFKLSLGSEKDLEDARYLYKLFEEHLDRHLLEDNIKKLRVHNLAQRYLWTTTL